MGISYSYNWLFLSDYTFYKWELVIVITGYFFGIIHFINGVLSTSNWYFGPELHQTNVGIVG